MKRALFYFKFHFVLCNHTTGFPISKVGEKKVCLLTLFSITILRYFRNSFFALYSSMKLFRPWEYRLIQRYWYWESLSVSLILLPNSQFQFQFPAKINGKQSHQVQKQNSKTRQILLSFFFEFKFWFCAAAGQCLQFAKSNRNRQKIGNGKSERSEIVKCPLKTEWKSRNVEFQEKQIRNTMRIDTVSEFSIFKKVVSFLASFCSLP